MPRFEGIVEEIRYKNEANGYTVITLRYGDESVAAVGVMPFLRGGEHIAITGEWTEHRDYGMQIRAESYETIRPQNRTAVERYLASGAIKGVKSKTASLIVAAFGENTLEILEHEPERLAKVPGIGKKKAKIIAESYQEQARSRDIMLFFQQYGISPTLANKIYKKYGDATREVVRADPYRLADDIDGVGFKTADAIAISMGVPEDDAHRVASGIKYVLGEAEGGEGHMFLPLEELMSRAGEELRAPAEIVENAIRTLEFSGGLRCDARGGGRNYYLPKLYDAEEECAYLLRKLMAAKPCIPKGDANFDVDLGDEQKLAVENCLANPVSIVTGGPGTGKTTCIRCVIKRLGGRIELCAPTGRAAKRMTEATGEAARTIHRLLEYSGEEEQFTRNEARPLECQTVIMDEASMLDIFLTRSFLRAVAPGTRVVFVGDVDQLPSVGAGNVLKDMIASGAIPTTRLTEIYRQARESMIVVNAHRINAGETPIIKSRDTNFYFEKKDTALKAADSAVALAATRLPKFFGFEPMSDIQVMSPMKKGVAGVYELNRRLQAAFNPEGRGRAEIQRGATVFREGDKIMQTRNDYELKWERDGEEGEGAFNGDIGFIKEIDPDCKEMRVLFDDGREALLREGGLENIEHAYCISVHKSQGSEFRAVVMPVVAGPRQLMTRNLLYTAVTRAREAVVLVGATESLDAMIQNKSVARRYSALAERISAVDEAGKR